MNKFYRITFICKIGQTPKIPMASQADLSDFVKSKEVLNTHGASLPQGLHPKYHHRGSGLLMPHDAATQKRTNYCDPDARLQ